MPKKGKEEGKRLVAKLQAGPKTVEDKPQKKSKEVF